MILKDNPESNEGFNINARKTNLAPCDTNYFSLVNR